MVARKSTETPVMEARRQGKECLDVAVWNMVLAVEPAEYSC